jgi:hypothetical protein
MLHMADPASPEFVLCDGFLSIGKPCGFWQEEDQFQGPTNIV